jgi:hypothetical protein
MVEIQCKRHWDALGASLWSLQTCIEILNANVTRILLNRDDLHLAIDQTVLAFQNCPPISSRVRAKRGD